MEKCITGKSTESAGTQVYVLYRPQCSD